MRKLKIIRNKDVRLEAGAFIPQEEVVKGSYISKIVQKKYYNYYNIDHRTSVCKADGIANRLTYGFADRVTAKTFKFYSSHDVDGKEIMKDQRARWVELNCDEILNSCIPILKRDGFVLLEMIKKGEVLDYNVYGEYESAPKLWMRLNNKIIGYGIQYTPQPRAFESAISSAFGSRSGSDYMTHVNRFLQPKDLIHVEYGKSNYGLGHPLIESCWDIMMKLIGESHQQMLDNRSIPTLHVTEDEYDTEHTKAKKLLGMVANSSHDTARVWYHKRLSDGSYSDFPKFAYESPTSNPEYNTRNESRGISSGQYGNISNEWALLSTVTGYSIHYFIGNTAGAVVGSETDKTEDDDQEIIDFGKIEKLIRKILDWLESKGLITIPEEPFVLKYWKDYERIEKAEKAKEEMEEKGLFGAPATDQPGDKDDAIDTQDNKPDDDRNNIVADNILNCMKLNTVYPMTEVMSSWIARIGYLDTNDRLYMQLLTGAVYSKPAPIGEWSYVDWAASGSKGGYFWDYLSQRDPPWRRDAIPEVLTSFSGFSETPEDMSEYKIEQVGFSRDPFSVAEMMQKLLDEIDAKNKEKDPSINNKSISINKVPILDFPLIDSLDTEGKIKKLGKLSDWSMGTGTATNIKKMLRSLKENANKHELRICTLNAQAFGNSIKESHPLKYNVGNGVIVEEFICSDSWKKNIGRKIPLGVYHNLDEDGSPELPNWQIVGSAEVFGFDDDTGEDFVKYNYDYEKIAAVFEKLELYDWLTPALKENGSSDISTAYYCDIELRWSDRLQSVVRVQKNIDLVSISFVPKGNCPGEVCSFKEMKTNIGEMQAFIKNCLKEGEDKATCLSSAYSRFKSIA